MLTDLLTAITASALMLGSGQLILDTFIQKKHKLKWNGFENLAYAYVCGFWLWITLLIPTLFSGASTLRISVFIFLVISSGSAGLLRIKRNLFPSVSKSVFLMIPFILWILPYAISTLLPNTGWDAAELHLPLGNLFIHQGNLFTHPVYYKFAITGGIQQIYGFFRYIHCGGAIIPFNFLAYLFTFLLIYGWSRRNYGVLSAWFSTGVFASISLLSELAVEPRIDGFLALFIGTALAATADYIEQTESNNGLIILSAIALGVGMAVKYTVVIAVAVIFAAICLKMIISRKISARTIIAAVILFSAPSAFWYVRNLVTLHDPVYPFLSQRKYPDATGKGLDFPVREKTIQFLNSLEPTHPINIYASEQTGEITRSHVPSNTFHLLEILLHPEKYTRKPGLSLSPLLLFFLVLPFLRRRPLDWCLWLTTLSGYLLLGSQTYLIRYLVLFFPSMAIGAGAVMSNLAKNRYIVGFFAAVIIALSGLNSVRTWQRLYNTDAFSLLSGEITESVWLQEVGYNNSRELPPALNKLNRMVNDGRIAHDDILLMVGEGKGDKLQMNYIPDGSWNGHLWQYLCILSNNDNEHLLCILNRMGVTHLMYNSTLHNWVMRFTDSNIKGLAFTHVTVKDFLNTYTSPIYVTPQLIIGKINYPDNPEFKKGCSDPQIPCLYGRCFSE